jgi:hypothetical protein
MNLLALIIPLSTMSLAGGTLGCSVTAEPFVTAPAPAPVPAGTLTVRWTVAGSVRPDLCGAFGATHLEVVVYDETGAEVTRTTPPCGGFSVTIPLPDGTYSADVTLIDPAGGARSTTKPLQAIEVVAGTDLAIDVDFPQSSIL